MTQSLLGSTVKSAPVPDAPFSPYSSLHASLVMYLYLGYGIVTSEPIAKDQFIVEYGGDLLSTSEGEKREEWYCETELGSYLYFFGDYW